MTKIVAYYRVSTRKQEKSGLGLEAQKSAVAEFVRTENGKLVGQYIEVESGKNRDRQELQRAIAHAKRSKARLVVAKLDRLARNVAFTSALMESKVDFVACDCPHANKFTIHILAAVAEHEADQISQRTKAALTAAKERGVKLGSARPGHWDGRENLRKAGLEKARPLARKAIRDSFNEEYADLFADLRRMRDDGKSLQQIADQLNQEGHTTRRGRPWNRMQVSRVLKKAGQSNLAA